jgi:quinone-modifying oxidoreductase subunit QmoC
METAPQDRRDPQAAPDGTATATVAAPERAPPVSVPLADGRPLRVEPDLDFIRALREQVGDCFLKCMQCGTCSATCAVSPDAAPFPRKEMIWAVWGLKDRLLADPDVWLCYNCGDCSTTCPRGARPGDVLMAVRREIVMQHAAPRFLGRWVQRSRYVPLLLGIPAALLGLALLVREPLGAALGLGAGTGEPIVYAHTGAFPHWLLNGFFLLCLALTILASVVGVRRFRRALRGADAAGAAVPVRGLGASLAAALRRIMTHDDFAACTSSASRYLGHMGVFFGFLALSLVTLRVITVGLNPLLGSGFVYPFGFWSPWKLLANAGGLALLAGCLVMIRDRLMETEHRGGKTYFQWQLVTVLGAVAVTGFATELLHYLRLEPHRHVVYFVHLTLACALLLTMPHSRLAHLLYRTTALIHAERIGRRRPGREEPDAGRGGPP